MGNSMVTKLTPFIIASVLTFAIGANAQNKSAKSKDSATAQKAADDAKKAADAKAEAEKKASEAKLAAAKKAAEAKAEAEKKALAKKQEEDKKAKDKIEAAAKKAAAEKLAAEEKEKKKSPYERAMEEAIAEDKISALQKYDVVLDMAGFSHMIRSNGLRKDKQGKVFLSFEAADLHSSKFNGSYSSAGQEEKSSIAKDRFQVYMKTNLNPVGLSVFQKCREMAETSMSSNQEVRISAKDVPHHTLFFTERELLRHYGYEKFLSRLNGQKKKYMSVKKFMNSIDDELIPRSRIGLNLDKLNVVCELMNK